MSQYILIPREAVMDMSVEYEPVSWTSGAPGQFFKNYTMHVQDCPKPVRLMELMESEDCPVVVAREVHDEQLGL